jgi:hypothetical protein
MSSMRSLFILALLSAPVGVAAENEATQVSPQLRQRAEDLAGAASNRFTDLLDGRQRTAQVSPQTPATEKSGTFAPVWDWLERSAQAYGDVVITQLKEKDGWTVIVQRNDEVSPPAAQIPAPAAAEEPQRELRGWSGLVEVVRDWLARANRSYRTEIVKPLLEPVPGAEPPSEIATQPAPSTRALPRPMAVPSASETAAGAVRDDDAAAERIKQEAKAADTNRAIDETESKGKAEDEKRLAEQADAKRKADADAKRIAEEAEQKRKGEDKRLAAEAEVRRKADDEKRIAAEAEAKRKADDVKRVAAEAEAKRKAAEEKRIAAEAAAKRKADDEKRVAVEAEAKRKVDDEKRVAAEAAAKRKADDAKREAEAADAAERRAVAQAEAEAKRQADIDAEATRRSEAAARDRERARETARAEAMSPTPATVPTAVTSPDVAQRATAPTTPSQKAPKAAGASTSPGAAASENSVVAKPPSAPERKPKAPESVREATPKAREEATVAEAPPAAVAKKKPVKRAAVKRLSGKKQASAYRHKRAYAHKKHRKPSYAHAHGRRHRAYAAEVVYVGRRCDCRCGRAFQEPRKRRHARWHASAPRHVFTERAYRLRPLKHRRGGLTYRHGRHYIR